MVPERLVFRLHAIQRMFERQNSFMLWRPSTRPAVKRSSSPSTSRILRSGKLISKGSDYEMRDL